MNNVELEAYNRMSEGFKEKFGEAISDDEYLRLCRLAGLARLHPVFNTFAEIDKGIKTITRNYKPKARYAKT